MDDKRGYTLIELILVLFLLVLIAFSVFSLTSVGSQTYLRLTSNQSIQSDLRVGLSYLDVKIRQNDAVQAIALRPFPFFEDETEPQAALWIERSYDDRVLHLWIYEYDGYLCELLVEPEAMATADMGNRIARVDETDFEVLSPRSMRISLVRVEAQERREHSRTITLKTGGIQP